MWNIDIGGAILTLVIIAFLLGLGIWGLWEVVDWLWVDDVIRVYEPLQYTIELEVVNGTEIDTVYVYQIP